MERLTIRPIRIFVLGLAPGKRICGNSGFHLEVSTAQDPERCLARQNCHAFTVPCATSGGGQGADLSTVRRAQWHGIAVHGRLTSPARALPGGTARAILLLYGRDKNYLLHISCRPVLDSGQIGGRRAALGVQPHWDLGRSSSSKRSHRFARLRAEPAGESNLPDS